MDDVVIHERTHCDGCGRALDTYAYNGRLLCPACHDEAVQRDQFVKLDSRPSVAKPIDERRMLWDM
jgi:uncharacterized Zn finger protein (UPF0148 family)